MRKQMLNNVSFKKIIVMIFTEFWTPLHPTSDTKIQPMALCRAGA